MKKLILIAHPRPDESVVHKQWMTEAAKQPENYTLHNICTAYPDGNIDILSEQQLIENHDELIIQFPCFWFSTPPLLKQWQDDVIRRGWAFGGGTAMRGKRVRLAVSAGMREQSYSVQGRMACTLAGLLLPFECVCKFIDAHYDGFHAFYGTQDDADDPEYQDKIALNTRQYMEFLRN